MSLIIKKNTTFRIPRTGSGASTTLPLSTPVIYINGRQFNKDGNYIVWLSDFPFERLSYGIPLDGWSYTDDEQNIISSNIADGSAIPLLGWNPSITITTL
jgi:hypothetical protein